MQCAYAGIMVDRLVGINYALNFLHYSIPNVSQNHINNYARFYSFYAAPTITILII